MVVAVVVGRRICLRRIPSPGRKGGEKGRKKKNREERKPCACTCHRVSPHVPVFQRRCVAVAGGRQLRVPSEGPPGALAPVVEQRVRVGGCGREQLSPVHFISLKTERGATAGLLFAVQ